MTGERPERGAQRSSIRYPTLTGRLVARVFQGPEFARAGIAEVSRRSGMSKSRLAKLARRPNLARVDELMRVADALALCIEFNVRSRGDAGLDKAGGREATQRP